MNWHVGRGCTVVSPESAAERLRMIAQRKHAVQIGVRVEGGAHLVGRPHVSATGATVRVGGKVVPIELITDVYSR